MRFVSGHSNTKNLSIYLIFTMLVILIMSSWYRNVEATTRVYPEQWSTYSYNDKNFGYYIEPETEGSYPVLIFIHGEGGVGSIHDNLIPLIEYWTEQGYMDKLVVVVPDIRALKDGTGTSNIFWGFESFSRDYGEDASHLLIDNILNGSFSSKVDTSAPLYITGYSLGGSSALALGAYGDQSKVIGSFSPSSSFYLGENNWGWYNHATDINYASDTDVWISAGESEKDSSGTNIFKNNISFYESAILENNPDVDFTTKVYPTSYGGHAWSLFKAELFSFLYWDKFGEIPADDLISASMTPKPVTDPAPSTDPTPSQDPDPTPSPTGVEGFVNRCYSVILGREPEEAGMQNWMNSLNNGTSCGAQVAYGFIFSQEYTNKNKSNEEFVTDLYLMFFDRNPDSAGLNNWLNQLNAKVMTKEQVFAAFAKSAEYKNICSDYGILQGCYIPGYSTASQTQVNLFVYRLYNTCLGRNADIGGLENWSRNILAGNTSGYSAALGFFTSTEYKNLNKSDEEFIKDLYTVMMDRNADAAGLANWVKQLTVYSREEVIEMFCKSQEFRNICARYGINVGV